MSTYQHMDASLRGAFANIGADIARLDRLVQDQSSAQADAETALVRPGHAALEDRAAVQQAGVQSTGPGVGMNALTARSTQGIAHLQQSIRDILTTPIGTRVMRRNYGSALFELIDAPLVGETVARIYAATAQALRKWEPRLKLTRVAVEALAETAPEGRISIALEGEYLPEGRAIKIEGVIV